PDSTGRRGVNAATCRHRRLHRSPPTRSRMAAGRHGAGQLRSPGPGAPRNRTTTLSTVAETALTAGVLLVGVYMVFVMEELVATRVQAATCSGAARHSPLQRAALELLRQQPCTVRPDNVSWQRAPALYLGLAAASLPLVPLAPGWGADVPAAIGLWCGLEALT